jgi:hypothetical protein
MLLKVPGAISPDWNVAEPITPARKHTLPTAAKNPALEKWTRDVELIRLLTI